MPQATLLGFLAVAMNASAQFSWSKQQKTDMLAASVARVMRGNQLPSAVANNTDSAADCRVIPRLYPFTACPLCRGVAVLGDNEL